MKTISNKMKHPRRAICQPQTKAESQNDYVCSKSGNREPDSALCKGHTPTAANTLGLGIFEAILKMVKQALPMLTNELMFIFFRI